MTEMKINSESSSFDFVGGKWQTEINVRDFIQKNIYLLHSCRFFGKIEDRYRRKLERMFISHDQSGYFQCLGADLSAPIFGYLRCPFLLYLHLVLNDCVIFEWQRYDLARSLNCLEQFERCLDDSSLHEVRPRWHPSVP